MALTQVQGAMVGPTGFANLSGITFPATQVPSADANTLDDYEEGTFTPTISASTPPSSVGYSNQFGKYTKVGNVVYVSMRVTFTFSGGSGSLIINGLPFTSTNNTQPKSSVQQDNITFTGYSYLEIGANGNAAAAGMGKDRSGAGASGVQISDCNGGGTDINTGFFYFTS